MRKPTPSGVAESHTSTAWVYVLTAAALVLVATLTACGERRLGWGVVLWPNKPGLAGVVLSISEESDIGDVYRYTDAETVHQLERWRVRLFADEEQAAEFAESYRHLANTFGYAVRKGLPVRETADSGSAQLYRLREGEAVKIIAREEGPVSVGDYTNFWYQVLTYDGTQGFTFGEFLPLFETDSFHPQPEANRLMGEDSRLDSLSEVSWRPQYYAEMLRRQRLDLSRLDEAYGFTIEPAVGTSSSDGVSQEDIAVSSDFTGGSARIRMPELALVFSYERIDRIGDRVFVLQGSGVRIVVESDWRIAVSFPHQGRLQTQKFVASDAQVSDLIAAERARRDGIYKSLRQGGPALQSSAYGDLLLEPERRFFWSGFERLVPTVIPADATGTGTVTLRLHLSRALRAEYTGVLTMVFDRGGGGPPESVDFLYARDDEGLRLALAGEINEEQLLVVGAAAIPLVIYFRFAS